MNRALFFILTSFLLIAFALADVFHGAVTIPFSDVLDILMGKGNASEVWMNIIWQSRIPKVLTALLAGAALAVCGLQMQTLFRNPLAGPYALGISSGASLGVAFFMLWYTGVGSGMIFDALKPSMTGKIGVVVASCIGSVAVLFLMLLMARRIGNNVTLLIAGLMIAHLAGAAESVLQYWSAARNLQGFVLWQMGSFSNLSMNELFLLFPLVSLGIICSLFLSKPQNALLMGDIYAQSLGTRVSFFRKIIILNAGLLAGGVTAFCGPIAFLGLAVPHIARNILQTSDHRVLTPAVCLTGAALAVFCDVISQMAPGGSALPVNAVTSLIGAPVVIWVILRRSA